MKWESAVPRKITWKTLWKMEPIRIQFTIRSTYDLLPTPTNLMRWGMSDDAKCGLCSEPGHLEHILSSCKTALTQRRFTWRHDTVLRKLAHHLELKRVHANKSETKAVRKEGLKFVKAGQTVSKTNETSRSVKLIKSSATSTTVENRKKTEEIN